MACCAIFLALLITAAVLVAFLVRIPTASVTSTDVQCNSAAQCNSYATTTGVPVQVTLTINNPNIIGATLSSNDLTLTDPSNNQQMATGSFPSTHISARGDSNIVATFNFPADAETVKFVSGVYEGDSYPIHITGHLHISLGALSFTYFLDQDETVPPQN